MTQYILDSLEISQFRGFRHLKIEKLGRVNLIVGKNNVGKSSLLEALQLYAQRGYPNMLWQILGNHDEDLRSRSTQESHSLDYDDLLLSMRYLFYGRDTINAPTQIIKIGPIHSSDNILSIRIGFSDAKLSEDGTRIGDSVIFEDLETLENPMPRLSIQLGKQFHINYPLEVRFPQSRFIQADQPKDIKCVFTRSDGLNKVRIGTLWDAIALTDREKEVLDALRIMAPGVEAISIVADANNSSRQRHTIVKVKNLREPIPIRGLGDGMQRMLGIALALVNAEDGLLLIDEIENGLHYSVQADLWKLIFRVAKQLNVQVFATTHSYDCIRSFQEAAQDDQQEGVLIRLEQKKEDIRAVTFDEQKLGIVTSEQIEIR